MTDEQKDRAVEIALRLVEKVGVPAAILAAFLWLGREAATSVNQNILIPIVAGHTRFLEATQETLGAIEKIQARQAETLDELATGQREIRTELLKGKERK